MSSRSPSSKLAPDPVWLGILGSIFPGFRVNETMWFAVGPSCVRPLAGRTDCSSSHINVLWQRKFINGRMQTVSPASRTVMEKSQSRVVVALSSEKHQHHDYRCSVHLCTSACHSRCYARGKRKNSEKLQIRASLYSVSKYRHCPGSGFA
jgi:hypothetical protein